MTETAAEARKTTTFWKTAAISTAVFSVLAFVFSAVIAAVWAQEFDDRIAPNVRIGSVDVSGMHPARARELVQDAVDRRMSSGISIDLNGQAAAVPLTALNGNGDTVEYVTFDIDRAVEDSRTRDRSANPVIDVALLLKRRFLGSPAVIAVPVTVNQDALEAGINAAFPDATVTVAETRFQFSRTRAGWNATVNEGHGGRSIDFPAFRPRLKSALTLLGDAPIPLTMTKTDAAVTKQEAELVLPDAVQALDHGPYRLVERPDGSGRAWGLTSDQLTKLILPKKEAGRVVLTLDDKTFDAFIAPVSDAVSIAPQNARFQIQDGKVVEFETSKTGLELDRDEMKRRLAAALFDGEPADVTLELKEAPPDVTNEQVNDLGVTEELGVGTSSFKNSPPNRIKNIQNGVRLLNGVLIAPGETFSLINALKPFDLGNGYLPELVIKGDKIEPELGGGLCQIGTTTFRAVMNSGLPVVSRSNHSLVVSYYNDPSNGNPGTDATIYEPAPDFKFLNDTGHYLLLQTVMNDATSTLAFHFWGTKDGRQGSYTPPKVIRWIPVGDEIRTVTPDLAAGQEKCQAAHVGADTTFTYTIVRPDGTNEDTVFDSHYRPLPKTCLVGAAETPPPIPIGDITTDGGATP